MAILQVPAQGHDAPLFLFVEAPPRIVSRRDRVERAGPGAGTIDEAHPSRTEGTEWSAVRQTEIRPLSRNHTLKIDVAYGSQIRHCHLILRLRLTKEARSSPMDHRARKRPIFRTSACRTSRAFSSSDT